MSTEYAIGDARPVPDFSGYLINSDAQLFSMIQNGTGRMTDTIQRQIKPTVNRRGYLVVGLYRNRHNYFRSLHSIVALTFLGPRPDDMEVCHRDGNKLNCKLDNLRYGTHQSNISDRIGHGTVAVGERHGLSKLTADKVREIRKLYAEGVIGNDLVSRFQVSQGVIYKVIRRELWKHVE